MDNRLKHRFSRIFRSSLFSCRDRNFSDVAEKAVFSQRNQSDLSSRMSEDPLLWSSQQKARPFPSICKPRCPESIYAIDHNCIMMTTSRPRRKLSARNSPFVFPDDFGGQACPPASPASPLFSTMESNNFGFYEKRKKKRKEKKRAVTKNQQKAKKRSVQSAAMIFSSSSQESFSYRRSWWSSSDEEDRRGNETDTLFSSRSLSSESSSSRRRNSSHVRSKVVDQKTGVVAVDRRSTKMKDSFAVVKSSSDPYNDFRTSMVEMILEKQIFSATGLEQLLQCFLSLNSNSHHRIIVEVFTEIYEALFSDWC